MTSAKKASRPARPRGRSFFRATFRQWVKRLLLTGVLGFAVLLGLILLAYSSVSLPAEPVQLQTSVIRDAAGNKLAELYKDENRVQVPLDQVADVLEKAVVATEDRHFYEHSGLDPIGITRALVNDIRGGATQGGSTITQQLVKNTYLTSERTIGRKAKEAILAVKVERQLGKRQILERYLNTVYFGRGASGIEQAAQAYFGVRASELQLPDAALLAGLIRAPETADPVRSPEAALRRRRIVLAAMVRAGDITQAEADAAEAAPLPDRPRPDATQTLSGGSAHFTAMVRRWAVREFGERVAFGGGLQIETTLDPELQAEAEKAVTSILDRPDDPDAALVSMTADGAVVALVGGKDFTVSQLNLATNSTRPQAGSTFKPFVLAAALEDGIPVTQRYPGPARLDLDFAGFAPKEDGWRNFGNSSFGRIDLTEATVHSVNTSYMQLAADVGLDAIARTAHDLGVDTEIPVVPAMALGSANVSPYEMLRSYMTFANRGKRIDPYYVSRVTDADGNVLYEGGRRESDAYPQAYADVVNHVLAQTIERGSGKAADIGRPAAGKTGTTSDNADAWFVGYTPKLGTAVWMGYKEGTEHKMNSVHGRAVTGGSFPAQIWQRYMKAATAGMDTGEFVTPSDDLLEAPQKETRRRATETPTRSGSDDEVEVTVPDDGTTTTTVDDGGSTSSTTAPSADEDDGGGPATSTTVPRASTTTAPPVPTTTVPRSTTTTTAPLEPAEASTPLP